MQVETLSRAIFARLARLGLSFSIFLLALIAALVVLQVAARNLFDLGLPWADELARFCAIGLVLRGRVVCVCCCAMRTFCYV